MYCCPGNLQDNLSLLLKRGEFRGIWGSIAHQSSLGCILSAILRWQPLPACSVYVTRGHLWRNSLKMHSPRKRGSYIPVFPNKQFFIRGKHGIHQMLLGISKKILREDKNEIAPPSAGTASQAYLG